MLDGWSLLLALSGWGAWLSKEIITKLLDRRLARTGRVGVIEGSSRVLCDTRTSDGGIVAVSYFPEMSKYSQYADCKRFRVEIECQFFNDTDTQVVFTQPKLEIWGVEGVRLLYSSPKAFVLTDSGTWQEAGTIAISSHGVTKARFDISLAYNFSDTEEEIRLTYGESVVLLRVLTISGESFALRICTSSFAGARKVVWPAEKTYPIYNLYSLNRDGRQAGRRPQERDVKENTSHKESAGAVTA